MQRLTDASSEPLQIHGLPCTRQKFEEAFEERPRGVVGVEQGVDVDVQLHLVHLALSVGGESGYDFVDDGGLMLENSLVGLTVS